MIKRTFYWILRCYGICLIAVNPALAQIVPDSTLGVESSIVIHSSGVDTISGGATRGSNLFHSFQEFSTPTGNTAFFNNSLNIENVITRVTGGQISNINGLIKANGTANLFFINPSGIVFGANARLDIGGSFLATTASNIKFTDGTLYSAAPQNSSPPLLTITAPVGLNFTNNHGAIKVEGQGHTLINPIFTPILGLNNSSGLQVQPGKTLALVGGDVILDGGILEGGNIHLGSVGRGVVDIGSDWSLNYQDAKDFQEIQLSRQALVNTSVAPGGFIQLQGQNININDGSAVFIQNLSGQPSGGIKINASDLLKVTGTTPDGRIASTLLTETIANGNGGDITVFAKRIIVESGGQILPRTFGTGRGGNSTINASESIQVVGFPPVFPNLFSNISAASFGTGDAGNITVTTSSLIGLNGIQIGSATFGSGSGGNVTINANDVTLSGFVPRLLTPSTINASTFSSGNAGSIIINSSTVRLESGGGISSSTVSSGNAGSVTVNASNFVVIDGIVSDSPIPSLIDSSALIVAPSLQQQLRIPSVPTGNAGSLTIDTPSLIVRNGGLVAVRNEGPGNAGTIQITADRINIANNGGISATTAIGEGGDIAIQTKLLQLNNGTISATAGQQGSSGNGGNITINADTIAGFKNSSITANAFLGRGGNIIINTQGLFLSPNSIITASSERGISGMVEVNASRTQPEPAKNQTVNVPQTPNVASVCQGRTAGGRVGAEDSFVITGTGGMPPNHLESVSINPGWGGNINTAPPIQTVKRIVNLAPPAQGWNFNPDGTVTLIAELNTNTSIALSKSCQ